MDQPDSPETGVLPQWPAPGVATSDEAVDAIIADLAQLPGLATREHREVYQQIHDDLLADLETGAD